MTNNGLLKACGVEVIDLIQARDMEGKLFKCKTMLVLMHMATEVALAERGLCVCDCVLVCLFV